MANLKVDSKIEGNVIYHHDNLNSAKEIIALAQGALYPKVFSKGIAAHGYGDSHNGMGNADKVMTSTDVVSRIGWTSASRAYGGCSVSNDFEFGYNYGGIASNFTTTDNEAPTNSISGATKCTQSAETFAEITGFNSTSSFGLGLWNAHSSALVMQNSLVNFHAYSTDAFTASAIVPAHGALTQGGMSNWHGKKSYLPVDASGGTIQKIDFVLGTSTATIGNGIMASHDQGTASYSHKVLVQGGANGSHNVYFFHFDTETFIKTYDSIQFSGEVQRAPAVGFNYALGGYDSTNGGQHNRSEKTNQDTGAPTTLSNTTYSMSSGAQYIH